MPEEYLCLSIHPGIRNPVLGHIRDHFQRTAAQLSHSRRHADNFFQEAENTTLQNQQRKIPGRKSGSDTKDRFKFLRRHLFPRCLFFPDPTADRTDHVSRKTDGRTGIKDRRPVKENQYGDHYDFRHRRDYWRRHYRRNR